MKKILDKIFEILVLIKSVFGMFEILAGLVLAVSGKLVINNIIIAITQQEILEDPNDIIAGYLIKTANSFSFFAVVYLIFHGLANIVLVVALLKEKARAYHWVMVGFVVFIVYQTYRYFHTYSPVLLSLTIFDIFFIGIIFLEYRKLEKIKTNK